MSDTENNINNQKQEEGEKTQNQINEEIKEAEYIDLPPPRPAYGNDDIPIGGGKKMEIPEFPEDQKPDIEQEQKQQSEKIKEEQEQKLKQQKLKMEEEEEKQKLEQQEKQKQNEEKERQIKEEEEKKQQQKEREEKEKQQKEKEIEQENQSSQNYNEEEGKLETITGIQRDPYGNDEIPIGKGPKFEISEFPEEGQQQPAKPKVLPKRLQERLSKKTIPKQSKEEDEKDKEKITQNSNQQQYDKDDKNKQNEIENQESQQQQQVQQDTQNSQTNNNNNVNNNENNNVNNNNINNNAFGNDEQPIGGGNGVQIPEFPEGESPKVPEISYPNPSKVEQDDYVAPVAKTSGPLTERVKDKKFATRKVAFEELQQAIENKEVDLKEFTSWDKFIADTNIGAQEKAVHAFVAYLKEIDQTQMEKLNYQLILKALVEKCIASDFLQPFIPLIEKHAQSTVAGIKKESTTFFEEVIKWLGIDIIKGSIEKLKDIQQKELQAFSENWEQNKTPMKPLRLKEEDQPKQAKTGKVEKIDLYDISKPKEIFNTYNEKWCDNLLKKSKWQEKKELLAQFAKEAEAPKLAGTVQQIMPVVQMIKRTLTDSNVNVMLGGIKVSGNLAQGLRRSFFQGAKILFGLTIQKFKEKKTLVIQETHLALANFFYSVQLDEVWEDIKEGITDKTPNMKVHTFTLLEKYFDSFEGSQIPKKQKECFEQNLLPIYVPLFDDGTLSVREGAIKQIGKFKTWISASALENLTSKLDSKKKKLFETVSDQIQDQIEEEQQQQEPVIQNNTKNNNDSSNNNKKVEKQKPLKKEENQTNNNIQQQSNEDDFQVGIPLSQQITYDEAFERLQEKLPLFISKINSKKNEEKVDAYFELRQNQKIFENEQDAVFTVLKKQYKDWKESNLILGKNLFDFILFVSENCQISKKGFYVVCQLILEKIGDRWNQQIEAFLVKSAACINPKYVILTFLQMLNKDAKKKQSFKIACEIGRQMRVLIEQCTVKFIPFKEVCDLAREFISNTNDKIRNEGQEIYKKFYEQMGKDVENFMNGLPQERVKQLKSEFQNIKVNKNAQPMIQFQGEALQQIKQDKTIGKNPVDSMPRANISSQANELLKFISDPKDWKKRKEGLDKLLKVLNDNSNRIKLDGLYDLVNALKVRIQDSNKSVARAYLGFIGTFAEACGKDIKMHCKLLLPPVISNLSDKNTLIQKECISSLDKFSEVVGTETVMNNMLPFLNEDSPELKTHLIHWILKSPDEFKKADLKSFVQPILNNLTDKNKAIRSLSENMLDLAVQVLGPDPFLNNIQDMKPAFKQMLKPLVEKFKNNQEEQNKTPKNFNQTQNFSNQKEEVQQDFSKTVGGFGQQQQNQNIQNFASINNNNIPQQNNYLGEPQQQQQQFTTLSQDLQQSQLQQQVLQLQQQNIELQQQYQTQKSQIGQLAQNQNQNQIQKVQFSEQNLIADYSYTLPLKQIRVQNRNFDLALNNEEDEEICRKQLMEFLQPDLSSQKVNLGGVSDLFLTWTYLRIFKLTVQQNSKLLLSLGDIFRNILQIVEKQNQKISDYEVQVSVGILVHLIVTAHSLGHSLQYKIMLEQSLNSLSKIYDQDQVVVLILNQIIQPNIPILQEIPNFKESIIQFFMQYLLKYVTSASTLQFIAQIPEIMSNQEICQYLQESFGAQTLQQIGINLKNQYGNGNNVQHNDFSQNDYLNNFTQDNLNVPQLTNKLSHKTASFNSNYEENNNNNNNNMNQPSFQDNLSQVSLQGEGNEKDILKQKRLAMKQARQQQQQQQEQHDQIGNNQQLLMQQQQQQLQQQQQELEALKQQKLLKKQQQQQDQEQIQQEQQDQIKNQQNIQQQKLEQLRSLKKQKQEEERQRLIQEQQEQLKQQQLQQQQEEEKANQNKKEEQDYLQRLEKLRLQQKMQQMKQSSQEEEQVSSQTQNSQNQNQNQISQKQTSDQNNINHSNIQAAMQEELQEKLEILKTQGLQEKIEVFIYLNNIIQESENEDKLSLLLNNSKEIMQTIYSLLQWSFANKEQLPQQFMQYFINFMHRTLMVVKFVKHLDLEDLLDFTDEILNRLIIEDSVEQKDEQQTIIIKVINSCMLRILSSTQSDIIFEILITLLKKYRLQMEKGKILGLIVRCTIKAAKNLQQSLPEMNIQQLMLLLHDYLINFRECNMDDSGIKVIRTIISEVIKFRQEKILEDYQIIQQHPEKDTIIIQMINTIYPQSGQGSIMSSRDLRMERRISAEKSVDQGLVDKIINTLKNTETFNQGVSELYELTKKHPNLNIKQYFGNCSQTFIEFVMSSLEKYQQQYDPSHGLNEIIQKQQEQQQQQQQQTQDTRQSMDYEEYSLRISRLKQRFAKGSQSVHPSSSNQNNNNINNQNNNSSIMNNNSSTFSNNNNNGTSSLGGSSLYQQQKQEKYLQKQQQLQNQQQQQGQGDFAQSDLMQKVNEMKMKMKQVINKSSNNSNTEGNDLNSNSNIEQQENYQEQEDDDDDDVL
ncbi:Armadillo-type fold [Pseudocohnilembus persalinus]|uniref:Armadillo-type fold n=1 Tax=Pseudocohnilembus persalinus TaxID=266149 RepID=A0A0V0QYM8_PSEPJ|nr:Armadillo-type fold [Pseudocohnilembus persalinus]|eukprot:KRX07362.1 Armadillo-type fold [Pseudocohnilembus persalinus]